ncbi:MAG: protein translocase subunit SecD, partial [Alphaproteobacteria bacterium]
EEASTLATILRAGALPAEIVKLEESKVGPELGAQAVAAGQWAALLAVMAVLLYMMISYGLFGLFANIALLVNLALILGIMTLLGFTLSLPGIAGIVLTIGMAVDANVLVFERMREVWRRSGNVGQAIENGYGQALSTILDANITTFIAAIVLFFIGKGAIQGFAVTLSIGILTSIFSALLFTRMLIGFWYGSGRRLIMPI